MPVENHEVHDSVKIKADKPYSCNSRKEFSRGYWVKERVYIPGDRGKYEFIDKFISYRMSVSCRNFYLWDTDPRCKACTAAKDHAYADKMRELE